MGEVAIPQREMTRRLDYFTRLPNDIILYTLDFLMLEIKSLGNLSAVCKKLKFILRPENEFFWTKVCLAWWTTTSQVNSNAFPFEEIVRDMIETGGKERRWKWFAQCFSHHSKTPSEKRNGPGWTVMEGACDIGEFKNGYIFWGLRLHLSGKFIGQRYIGSFEQDKMQGYGLFVWPSGKRYLGDIDDGNFCGKGTHFWPDGKKYVGEFKADKMCGLGVMSWPNGFSFEGQFQNSIPIDETISVHPDLKAAYEMNQCTCVITKETEAYGQWLYQCTYCTDRRNYCLVCKELCHTTHQDCWKKVWTFGPLHCACSKGKDTCNANRDMMDCEAPTGSV